ncbi:MAG: glycosyltransferase, partial [Planctomycetes bacterium]|nr:glycosyltransferase [Planctomycetota bacterium]
MTSRRADARPAARTAADRPLTVVHFAVSGGGVKRHILDFAAGCDRSRVAVVGVAPEETLAAAVAGSADGRYRAAFERLGLPFLPLEVPRWHAPRADARAVLALARILRRLRPDVLHCHSSKAGLIGRLAAPLARVPAVVYTPHAMFYTSRRGAARALYRGAERLLLPLADAIIAVSASEGDQLNRDLRPGRRLVRINNGIAPYGGRHDPAAVRRGLGLPAAAPVILTPARCEPQKDIRTLILALREVPAAVLLVAGDGHLRPDLERLAAGHGLTDRVRFLGWVDDLEPVMAASDIVALSSWYEGLPYAILEAAAMGKPTVGRDVMVTRDGIVDGSPVVLVPPGDAAAKAGRLALLARR